MPLTWSQSRNWFALKSISLICAVKSRIGVEKLNRVTTTRVLTETSVVRAVNMTPTTRLFAATPSVMRLPIAGICCPATIVDDVPLTIQSRVKFWLPNAVLVAA